MQVARRHEGKVQFVGMAGRDEDAAIEQFVSRHGLERIPTTIDRDGSLWAQLGAVGQPTWLFVDGETGRVEKVFGVLGEEGLEERIAALAGTPRA